MNVDDLDRFIRTYEITEIINTVYQMQVKIENVEKSKNGSAI